MDGTEGIAFTGFLDHARAVVCHISQFTKIAANEAVLFRSSLDKGSAAHTQRKKQNHDHVAEHCLEPTQLMASLLNTRIISWNIS